MYNFNLMANYTAAFLDKTKEVPLGLARKKYARPSAEMIKKAQVDSISFLIVRHPLERLASAYNDKIVHAWPKSFHDKMGYRIIRKYRKVSFEFNYITGIARLHFVREHFADCFATLLLPFFYNTNRLIPNLFLVKWRTGDFGYSAVKVRFSFYRHNIVTLCCECLWENLIENWKWDRVVWKIPAGPPCLYILSIYLLYLQFILLPSLMYLNIIF